MAGELRFPRINVVVISGRLTRDIELRYTPNGVPVASLPIAFDRVYKDASGEYQSIPSYIDVVVWNKQAEKCAQTLHKGSPILVEGHIQTRTYEAKDGQNRKIVEIHASRVNFLEKPQDGNQGEYAGNNSYNSAPPVTDDDVPF